VSRAAVLLFGHEPQHWLPHAMIVGARFDKRGQRVAHAIVKGTLPEQVDTMMDWVTGQMADWFPPSLQPANGFPRCAFRCVLTRALLLRDYATFGATSVLLHPTTLRVQYPVKLDRYRCDNRSDCGYITPRPLAQDATGTVNMRYVLEGTGWLDDLHAFIEDGAKLPLECGMYRLAFQRDQPSVESATFMRLTTDWENRRGLVRDDARCQRVLDFLEEHSCVTNKQCRELLSVSDETARSILAQLVQKGFVRLEGAGRAARYVRSERSETG
jgi:predicted HTH transcriptional regulator